MRISMIKEAKTKTVVDTLKGLGPFTILVKCLRATGLITMLGNPKLVFTIFAPNDRAFKQLVPQGQLRALLKDKARLQQVIRYHLVTERIELRHTDNRVPVRTMEGSTVLLQEGGSFLVNNARVLRPDMECMNGMIHEIDAVLLPK